MKKINLAWKIKDLVDKFKSIDFPEYQREPTVWKLPKKQRLIDSILRDFDIASIYLYRKQKEFYDCIDGRQRMNAIMSFVGKNPADEEDNAFHLKMTNEIFSDLADYKDVDNKRYSKFSAKWKRVIDNYKLNIVEITDVADPEELNLLFLRLQLGSVLNAGEKLHAMTGDMRDFVFRDIGKRGLL